jgi:hypothetical protein
MRKMLYWLNVVIGLWIAASPWVLNFREVEYAFYSSLASGLAVAAIALAGWLAEENPIKLGGRRANQTGSLQAA